MFWDGRERGGSAKTVMGEMGDSTMDEGASCQYLNRYDGVADLYDHYNRSAYDIDFYIKRYKGFRGRAVELMAGTGRLAVPLLRSGMNLDCVDVSVGLLEQLKKKLEVEHLKAKIINADIRELRLDGTYQLVFIGFNSLSEIVDDHDRGRIFESIYHSMADDGEFLFSLYNPVYRRKLIDHAVKLVSEFEYQGRSVLFFIASKEIEGSIVELTQFYEFYHHEGLLEEKKILKLKFKLIEKSEIESLIRKTGFKIKNLYGDYNEGAFDEEHSPFMIYALSK